MNLIFARYHVRQRLFRGILMGLIIVLSMGVLINEGLFSTSRTQMKDILYQGTSRAETSDLVSIVAIDDDSLNALGRSPAVWSREAHADLTRIVNEGGARVLAYDILFAEPSPDDTPFIAALELAAQGEPGVRRPMRIVQPVGGIQNQVGQTRAGELLTFERFLYPLPDILEASQDSFGRQYTGHVNFVPDDDGAVRTVPLIAQNMDEEQQVTLGLASYLAFLGLAPDAIEHDEQHIRFANRDIVVDEFGRMLLYFFAPPAQSGKAQAHTFPIYSYIDVLCSASATDPAYALPGFGCADRPNPIDVPPDVFQDRIVLVGVLGTVTEPDRFPVPVASNAEQMFGVEIHANIIENLHQTLPTLGRELPLRSQSPQDQVFAIGLLCLIGALGLPVLRWYVAFVVAVVLYAGYFVLAVRAFQVEGVVYELLLPAIALSLLFAGIFISNYLFEERRRNQINDLFRRYVSPEIAQRIVEIDDRGELALQGEEREITVMFADMRGFTSLSEGLPPQEVVSILNRFLERMNAVVLAHGGAINKYLGDNLMAFWNAPYNQPDHAVRAVRAGHELLRVIEELNEMNQFSTPIRFGIGINTGVAVIGNIGSQLRLEYTPVGDTVNVASRLSNLAQGGSMLIGQGTYEQLNGQFSPDTSQEYQLKGRTQSLMAHEFRLSPAVSFGVVEGMGVDHERRPQPLDDAMEDQSHENNDGNVQGNRQQKGQIKD